MFNGSALGKEYTAKGIQERCVINITGERKENHIVKSHTPESLVNVIQEYKDVLSIADIDKI